MKGTAVPIRKHGKIVAAISVAIPLFRYEEAMKEKMTQNLQKTAWGIGSMLEQTDAHFADLF